MALVAPRGGAVILAALLFFLVPSSWGNLWELRDKSNALQCYVDDAKNMTGLAGVDVTYGVSAGSVSTSAGIRNTGGNVSTTGQIVADGSATVKGAGTFGGSVGIGTTSPGAKLDVNGDTALRGAVTVADGSTITVHSLNGVAIKAVAYTGTNAVVQSFNNSGSALYVGKDNSAGSYLTGGTYASAMWDAGNYPIIFGTNNTRRMQIDGGGATSFQGPVTVAGSSLTVTGLFHPQTVTLATMQGITPSAPFGGFLSVSNAAVPYSLCYSTAATIQGFTLYGAAAGTECK